MKLMSPIPTKRTALPDMYMFGTPCKSCHGTLILIQGCIQIVKDTANP